MTRGKRRVNKPPSSPTIVPTSTKVAESTTLPPDVARLQTDITLLSSKDVFILAPVAPCFELLAKQLEKPPEWDPIIINVWPVSKVRRQIGATSQVTLNLGGRNRESLAMICRYRPNRAIG